MQSKHAGFALLLLLTCSMLLADGDISIGTGTSTWSHPLGTEYGYERTAELYLASEINTTGMISHVDFYATLEQTEPTNIKIYFKLTSASTLTADTWDNLTSGATVVFNAMVGSMEANSWIYFNCPPVFIYPGGCNLLVLVETNNGGTGTGNTLIPGCLYTDSNERAEIWMENDSPPTGNGTLTNNLANIRLGFLDTLSGDYTVGFGGDYTTLTEAVADLNLRGVSAPVHFSLTDWEYSSMTEFFPITINQVAGASISSPVIIEPLYSGTMIWGGSTQAIIRLHGADYITIKGRDGDPFENFIIQNYGGGSSGTTILFDAQATHNTISNLEVQGSITGSKGNIYFGSSGNSYNNLNVNINWTSTYNSYYGICLGYGNNSYNNITGNIGRVMVGIYSSSEGNIGNSITNMELAIKQIGIDLYFANDTNISNVNIHTQIAVITNVCGIRMTESPGTIIHGCKIYDLNPDPAYSVTGIQYAGVSGTFNYAVIFNNLISLSPANTGNVIGIDLTMSEQNTVELYFNSVYLGGSEVSNGSSYALRKQGSLGSLHIYDNIFTNCRSNGSGTGSHYAVAFTDVDDSWLNMDYNLYYNLGSGSCLGFWDTGDISALATWQSVTGGCDLHSLYADPLFVDPTLNDLHIYQGSPALGTGIPMGAVNLDFDSNVRDLDHPTIGAYELAIPVALQSPVVSIEYSPGGVILSWEPVTGASHYMIYFADSPDGPWDVYLPVNLTVTTWGDIDSSAQKRFYRVTASN